MVVALADGSVALGDGPALTIAPTGATASRDTYPSISAGMFATVGGMVACAGSERMVVFVRVSQGDGPMLSRGAARTAVSCTGEPESWHVNVYSDGRPFPAGEADVNAYVSSLPVADDRGEARGEAAITLR